MPITGITVADQPVALGAVIAANVTVIHGRATVGDGPTPSAADITLLVPASAGMPTWSAGDPITITADHGPLFTGTIADRRLSGHINTVELGPCAQLEIMCAGPLAVAGYRVVGDEPWPQETGSARAGRILTLAGLPHLVQIPTTPNEVQVLARDVDAQPALTLLADLAADTGAAVVDLPDGRILYQPLETRYSPVFLVRWMDLPPAQMWAQVGPAVTWADLGYRSPASILPVDLPPGAVLAEPEWVATAAGVINQARVGYGATTDGANQPTQEASDAASIARYGRRYAYLGTQLASQADALARASRIITTRARERWALGDVTVWEEQLPAPTAAAVAALVCGKWAAVSGLPQPAPAAAWAAVVEGWTYVETKTSARHDMWWTLALSDPLHSLAVFAWADFNPAYLWSSFPPLTLWYDLASTTPPTGALAA